MGNAANIFHAGCHPPCPLPNTRPFNTRQMDMWSRKVFFLLVVKIFVTVISTMDYIYTVFYVSTRNKINIHTTLTRARTLSSELN